jgi:histidine kinase
LQLNLFYMNESSIKIDNFRRVEFWGATTLFVFVLFFFITDSIGANTAYLNTSNKGLFTDKNLQFNYYANFFFPELIRYCLIFSSFVYVNFIVIPQLARKQHQYRNVLIIAVIAIISTIVFGIAGTYSRADLLSDYPTLEEAYYVIFFDAFLYVCRLLLLLVFYTILKYVSVYLLVNVDAIRARYPAVTRGGIIALIIWSIVLFLLAAGNAQGEILVIWTVIVPSSIFMYWASFYKLIPDTLGKNRPFLRYAGKAILVTIVITLPIVFMLLIFLRHEEFSAGLSFANFLVQVFITVPLSWVLFKRYIKGNEELYALQKELGKSNASLDFLRSQINPHFLFNALNTLYGTAIQEKADKTSEGIQQLGDMMRFMLQENLQDKISLARETEYLANYIALQKLRTDSIPQVRIDASIEDTVENVQIAPMLLIPFVENAFKHGISFREPSLIKISLDFRDNTIYFDVTNNKHKRQAEDPEKMKSGIGLTNVKQRLQHVYPGKHELIIRETSKEFFVHLTIRLSR